MLLKAGFHRAGLVKYTGFKSSPYTEGALFYGEKLVDARAQDTLASQAEGLTELQTGSFCEIGGT